MIVEWLQSARGRRASHAKIDGAWCCRWAPSIADFVPTPKTSLGHPRGDVCAQCAIEVNARAVLARDEERSQ